MTDLPMMSYDPIVSYGGNPDPEKRWRSNGEMIRAAVLLGYIDMTGPVLDPTFRKGTFWSACAPADLTRTDLDPRYSPDWPGGLDATHLPFDWTDRFATVVLDPPYKLNGTDQGEGDRYGVADGYQSVEARHALMSAMMIEAVRVLAGGGHLLFKCQDQTNGGRKRWQARMFSNFGEDIGLTLVDQLLFPGYRKQPARSTCLHCRQKIQRRSDGRWSTLKRDGSNLYVCVARHDGPSNPYGIDHEPDPTVLGQDGSHVNYSALLIFEKPHLPKVAS